MVLLVVKPEIKYKECKICKTLHLKLSRKGYCQDCSITIATNAILQLQVKEGEIYEKWKTKTIAGMKKEDQKKK